MAIKTDITIDSDPIHEYIFDRETLYLKYEGKKIPLGRVRSLSQLNLPEQYFTESNIEIITNSQIIREHGKNS